MGRGGILILALAMWGGMSLINKGSHGSIRITVDGKEYGTYSLEKDQTIKINDTNVCEIKDGQARMISAQCPDHLCMKQKAIDEKGGTGADNHNAAQEAENGAQSAVFKAQRRRFKQTPNNGRKQSHHKEADHNDQDSRNDDARQPSDAFKRNVFGDNRGIVHRQKDAIEENDVVLLHDDLLATGGSAGAALKLISMFNPKSVLVSFMIELEFLNGRPKLEGTQDIHSLIKF
jgi:hypothetical protein